MLGDSWLYHLSQGQSYLYRICLDVRALGTRVRIWLAMMVHWEVPNSSIRLRIIWSYYFQKGGTSGVHNFLSPIFSLQNDCQDFCCQDNTSFLIRAQIYIQVNIFQGETQINQILKAKYMIFFSGYWFFLKKLHIKWPNILFDQAWLSDDFINYSGLLNLVLKMKVYSASKVRRSSFHLNEAMKANIQQLASLLKSSSSQSLPLSPSVANMHAEEEAINLSRQFVANLSDPFQCMLLYPLVLDCTITCQPDTLFQLTSFPQQLHPLLTLYLYKCTSYTSLERISRKIIDLFYRYVSQEASEAYEVWLNQQNRKSLGQWFYSECISSFFQQIYKQKDLYTIFLINYLKHDISYLFACAVAVLKGKQSPLECDSTTLDRIKSRYIQKYLKE